MRLLSQFRLVHSAAAGPLISLGSTSGRYTQGMGPLPIEKPSTKPITAINDTAPSATLDTARTGQARISSRWCSKVILTDLLVSDYKNMKIANSTAYHFQQSNQRGAHALLNCTFCKDGNKV